MDDATLDALLDAYDPDNREVVDEVVSLPVPDDEAIASRYLRRLRGVRRELDAIKRRADAERAFIDRFEADTSHGLRRMEASIVATLEQFARAVNRLNGKKTWTLPLGTLRLRPRRRSMVVVDEAAFTAWAKENDAAGLTRVAVVPDLDALSKLPARPDVTAEQQTEALRVWAAAKPERIAEGRVLALFNDSGEAVPGVFMVEPDGDNFTLKPKEAPREEQPNDHHGAIPDAG